MNNDSKILIISITVGEGHNAVSKAIETAFLKRGFLNTKIIQFFGYSQKRLKMENKMYLTACKYVPKIYNYFWTKTKNANPENRDKMSVHFIYNNAKKYIKNQIDEFDPDLIISTHTNCNTIVSDLKREKKIKDKVKSIAILTDYCAHPYWETGLNCDYVISPHKVADNELIKKGYTKQQVKTLGYIVNEKFSAFLDKQEARKIINIPDKFTVMIMNGGNGLGKNLKLIKLLTQSKKDFQIVCICGRNVKGKKQLDNYLTKNNIKNVFSLGFVNNIEQIMSASDCIFSRGGAVSLTEAVNINLPIIIRENMIINEQINKDFFIKEGIALGINSIYEARPTIENLIDNPKILKDIKQNQKKFRNLNAANDLVDFVDKL